MLTLTPTLTLILIITQVSSWVNAIAKSEPLLWNIAKNPLSTTQARKGMGLKPNPLDLSSFSALTLLVGSFDP